ncbi:hypothetical protein [Pseudomonas sp. RC10]|uniref:hypothetical protein n=1 Tax=Pseudomonas bambusae TaxID=3139142 RepID=UPI0031397CA4
MSRPYAFINDEVRDYYQFRDYTLKVPASARAKFDQLNAHLRPHPILPGQVLVMTDGPSHLCTPEENELMLLARNVRLSMSGSVCAALGLPSAGTVLIGCAVVFGVAGAIGGGELGSPMGAVTGQHLFSWFEQ